MLLANNLVSAIELPQSLTVTACMPWAPGDARIERDVTLRPSPNATDPIQLVVEDQRFLDYFVVLGRLVISDLVVIAPAGVQRSRLNTLLPVIFVPQQLGVVYFRRSLLLLSANDTRDFRSDGPVAIGAKPVSPDADLASYTAIGRGARLSNGLYFTSSSLLGSAVVAQLLQNGSSPFHQQVQAAGPVAGWNFSDYFTAAPTAYAGGLIVSGGTAFAGAINSTNVSKIYVARDIGVGAVFEAHAVNASVARYLVDRDLHIYGDRNNVVDFGWSAEVVRVLPGRTLLIDGGLELQRVPRPTLSSLPYNFFLGVFVFETGARLRLSDTTVEHLATDDPELWELAGTNTLPSTYSNASWSAASLPVLRQYTSLRYLQAMRAFLPPSSLPRLQVDLFGNLQIVAWTIDEPTWDNAVFGQLNSNDLFGSYELANITLASPAAPPDECDALGVAVSDSPSFYAALQSNAYRIKLMASFAMDAADWLQPGSAGVMLSRRFRVVGCASTTEYTVVDTANLPSVLLMCEHGSMQIRRVHFTNVNQMPSRLYITPLVGMFDIMENATIDFEDCAFEGAQPTLTGPMLDDAFTVDVSGIATLLPNSSYKVVLQDPVTQQLSRLVSGWSLTNGLFLKVTQGNLSALNSTRASWNYLTCVVSAKIKPYAGDEHGLSESAALALEIALPVGVALLLALCCLLYLLRCRRRRRHEELAVTKTTPSSPPAPKARTERAASKSTSADRSGGRVASSGSKSGSAGRNAVDAADAAAAVDAAKDVHALVIGDRIDAALAKIGRQAFSRTTWDHIKLGTCIGAGGFSKVYKGYWRGSVVAVKVINLPEALSHAEKLKRMTAMETAISSSLTHPNIITTYTYAVRTARPASGEAQADLLARGSLNAADSGPLSQAPDSSALRSRAAQPDPPFPSESLQLQEVSAANPNAQSSAESNKINSSVSGDGRSGKLSVEVLLGSVLATACEVRLVQEFAPWGTLRNGIDAGRLCVDGDPRERLDFAAVLDTAMDVCKALVHLHNESVVHCDLKPSNVLLVPSSASRKGFVAKVADFGMAQSVPLAASHVSDIWHGTLTHMAPEALVYGHVTLASDIYAFAVVMWEIVTGQTVKLACPASMLPFMVSARGMRPIVPSYVPQPFADLIRSCWAGAHARRPSAQAALEALAAISTQYDRGALGPCRLGFHDGRGAAAAEKDDVNTELTADRIDTGMTAGVLEASPGVWRHADGTRQAAGSVAPLTRSPVQTTEAPLASRDAVDAVGAIEAMLSSSDEAPCGSDGLVMQASEQPEEPRQRPSSLKSAVNERFEALAPPNVELRSEAASAPAACPLTKSDAPAVCGPRQEAEAPPPLAAAGQSHPQI